MKTLSYRPRALARIVSAILCTNAVGVVSAQVIQLSDLDGNDGFRLNGIDATDRSGVSVAGAGDINGDGIDDIVVSAYQAQADGLMYAGETYVVFGDGAGFPADFELSSLDGTNGFRLDGTQVGGRSGYSVAVTDSINGDSFDDLIIGAAFETSGGGAYAGRTYVVFGSDQGFAASIDLSALNGTNGFRIDGENVADLSGSAVAHAGDVNDDGFDDIIIGASAADVGGATDAGSSYVIFGDNSVFPAAIELSDLDGNNGFKMDGGAMQIRSGVGVSGAGDFNGDGIDDVVVGALFADPNGVQDAGQSFVVFGRDTAFPATIALTSLDGMTGVQINGISPDDFSGVAVSGVGDFNGDDIDDIIIGARGADAGGPANAGEAYVIFGSNAPFSAMLELSDLDGGNGFQLNGIANNDLAGNAVAGAGDVNRDGLQDVIVGARSADPMGEMDAGESYVVFGNRSALPQQFELSELDGENGFTLQGIAATDLSGFSVAAAGDINNDGTDDVIIGAFEANPGGRTEAGQSYVVYGVPIEVLFRDGFEDPNPLPP